MVRDQHVYYSHSHMLSYIVYLHTQTPLSLYLVLPVIKPFSLSRFLFAQLPSFSFMCDVIIDLPTPYFF